MRTDRAAWSRAGLGLAVGTAFGCLAVFLDLPSLVSFWGDRSTLVLVAAVLGAVVWSTRLRLPFAVATLALGLAWVVAAFTPITPWLASGLTRSDALAPADGVFVLGSRIQKDGGLSTAAMTRLIHGLELVAQGWAPRLVLSELPPPFGRYEPAARELMQKLGLSHEILTVGPVRSTRDEAVAVAALFRERGYKRVLVVTSPTHSLRAAAALEHEGLVAISSPSTETQFDLEALDYPDDRLRAMGTILHERLGLWVYRRRGWIE